MTFDEQKFLKMQSSLSVTFLWLVLFKIFGYLKVRKIYPKILFRNLLPYYSYSVRNPCGIDFFIWYMAKINTNFFQHRYLIDPALLIKKVIFAHCTLYSKLVIGVCFGIPLCSSVSLLLVYSYANTSVLITVVQDI